MRQRITRAKRRVEGDVLESLQSNVFSSGEFDEILESIDDGESTVLVPLSDISRLEPSVGGDRLSSNLISLIYRIVSQKPSDEEAKTGLNVDVQYPLVTEGPRMRISP